MASVYKYFSGNLLPIAFSRPGYCGLKCSLPKDYNDPYELFLGADLGLEPEALATYRDIIQDLPQFHTTCFSHSPVVSPMWAHYANNHTGFVLEFDKDFLDKTYPDAALRDVTYRSEPNPQIKNFVQMAAVRAKPRDAYHLQHFVMHQAYFSKYVDWSYEQECRLTGLNSYIERVNDVDVLFLPMEGLTSLLIGSRAPKALARASQEVAEESGLNWYKTNIGKSYPLPFLTNASGRAFVFDEGAIKSADSTCGNCEEPLHLRTGLCPWCNITEDDDLAAASRNPYRILDHYGVLEEYLKGADDVGQSRKR